MSEFLFQWPPQIALAFLLDLLFGDPEYFFHPVRCVGKAIQALEPLLRKYFRNLRVAGIVLAVSVVGGAVFTASLLLLCADRLSPWTGALLRIYFFYACLGVGDLAGEVRAVLAYLQNADVAMARSRLSRIVGRDTQNLDEGEILRALVETTAESTSDGVVSVLFYSFLGGPLLAMAFKAASTLDSMVGYKNEAYRELGWASARLDDALNFIPARMTAMLASLAAILTGGSLLRAVKTVLRDAKMQPSPNSGYPEAAFAGALGVQLGGQNLYGGVPANKAKLGDARYALNIAKANAALQLMFITSFLCLLSGVLVWIF